MIDENLVLALSGVGFEEKEARVYLALSEIGKASVSEIAAKAELKRPAVYYLLENLKTRGYVQDVAGDKVKRFSAIDPGRVLHNNQIAVEEFRFMLPLIRALQEKGGARPRIEYLEGKDAVVAVYRLFEKRKRARFLTSIKRLNTFMPEEVESWVRRYESGQDKEKTHATLLTDTPEDRAWADRAMKAEQNVRTLPKGMEIEMDFSMVDDILSITSFDPLFIVVIHSERIARSSMALFDLAWKTGKEIKKT